MPQWKWIAPHPTDRADKAIQSALESGAGTWTGAPRATSRTQVQRLLEEGKVLLGSGPGAKTLKANMKILAGQEIQIEFSDPKPLDLVPEDRPLDILFQDAHLLVLNKPQGLTVHPSSTQSEGTLVHALLHHIRDLSGIGGVLRPGIVHRIDKDTSGALVITKTDEAHRSLVETFAKHDIERTYWALCYGSPPQTTARGIGTLAPARTRIESLIGRSPTDRKKMSTKVNEGRKAVSYYRCLEEYGTGKQKPFASWLEVTLETGRTHQVRVHLESIGHSVMGDPAYGTPGPKHPKLVALPAEVRRAVLALPGQALHARVLGFTHPITGEKLRFEAEPPAAFTTLLRALQGFV